MASPVAGLRPMRALRSTRTRRPMPGRTVTPFFLVSAIAISAYAVVKAFATLVGTPTVSASFLINWDCVIFAAAILLLFRKSNSPEVVSMLRFRARATVANSDRHAFTTASYGMHNPGVKGKVQKNTDYSRVSCNAHVCGARPQRFELTQTHRVLSWQRKCDERTSRSTGGSPPAHGAGCRGVR